MEMNGSLASSMRPSAAETFASCIRLTTPSIMRAPPEQATTMSGSFLPGEGTVARPRNFFADDGAHGTTDKTKFHRAADHGPSIQAAFGGDDRILHIEFALRFFQALRVGLGIGELERVAGGQVCVQLGPRFLVEKHFQAAPRTEAEMVLTLGADFPIRFQGFFPNDGAAGIALRPHAFGVHAAFLGRRGIFDRFFFALEPGHGLRFLGWTALYEVNSSSLKVES